MKSGFLSVLVVAAVILALGGQAHGGWMEVDSHSGTTYLSEGKVKNVPRDKSGVWSVFDVNKSTITLVNPAERSYTEFDVDKFCGEMKSMMGSMMSGMTPEQRAMMEQMMGGGGHKKAPKVSVVRRGTGTRLAGYNTVMYSVAVNGRPYKDVWLATGAAIVKDVRKYIKKAMEMSTKMESCTRVGPGGGSPAPETTAEYMGLLEKGWPMKELNRESGEVEAEVTSLKKKNVPASEFRVPAGYRRVGMKDMMGGMK
ncbi:MAG: DUF4412 domain-containing protein [Thermodesulfobacteriota bacterium]